MKRDRSKDMDFSDIHRKIKGQKMVFDWKNSIGKKIFFVYDDIEGYMEIVEYINNKNIGVKWDGKIKYISAAQLIRGEIGRIIEKKTSEFYYEIGQRIFDEKRDLIITERGRIKNSNGRYQKSYKYKCLKCGFDCGSHYKKGNKKKEMWIAEGNLRVGKGCSACVTNPLIVVENINSIVAQAKWMVDYFKGGYEEAKMYTPASSEIVSFCCPTCKKEKKLRVATLKKNGLMCPSCSDGFSYPEKFLMEVLDQIQEEYVYHPGKEVFSWCKRYIYDFYLVKKNVIIETHGKQHYEECKNFKQSLSEIQKNDLNKLKLVEKNLGKNKMIVIDCRKSNMDYMKENIIKELGFIVDLSNVDWEKCEINANGTKLRLICRYYEKNKNEMSMKMIAKNMGIDYTTLYNYIDKGIRLGWCSKGKQRYFDKESKQNQMKEMCDYYEQHKNEMLLNEMAKNLNVSASRLIKIRKQMRTITSQDLSKKKPRVNHQHEQKHRERCEFYEKNKNKMTKKDMASFLGVSDVTLNKSLEIGGKNGWIKNRKEVLDNEIKSVCSFYEAHKNEMTDMQISEQLNISVSKLNSIVQKGCQLGYCTKKEKRCSIDREKMQVIEAVCSYYNKNKDIMSLKEIAENRGIGLSTLNKYIRIGKEKGFCEIKKQIVFKKREQWEKKRKECCLYYEENREKLSLPQCAKNLGISDTTLRRYLEKEKTI